MKKILILLVALTMTSVAQDLTVLKVKRFSPALSAQNQYKGWTTAPSLLVSKTDTTDIFTFKSTSPIDTLLESVVYSTVADTLKMSVIAQFTLKGMVVSTGVVDSVVWNISTAVGVGNKAKGKRLWFSRPPGSDGVRLIIATAATNNHGSQAATPGLKTYNAAIVTRMK
jgi:hypothetical protein